MLKWLDQLGDLNPQLFRELKGSFKPHTMMLIVGLSFFVQLGIISATYKGKCIELQCLNIDVLKEIEWSYIFYTLGSTLPVFLLVGGVYRIVANLAKEEERGTLNFIRLSPQSSQSILLGKILGVPAPLFLIVATGIPLHFVSGLALSIPFSWLIGTYALWGMGCALFFTAAVFLALFNTNQPSSKYLPWTGFFIAFSFASSYVGAINSSFELFKNGWLNNWKWLLIPVGSNSLLVYTWAFISLSHATYWFWQAINRRFRNPNRTILSKEQSYWLVASVQVWLLGFALPEINASNSAALVVGLAVLFVLNPLFFMAVAASLYSQRQALQDWARYRRDRVSERKGSWNNSLLKDLIWSEKSPAIVAIAVNLVITSIIWIPWILLWPTKAWGDVHFQTFQALLGLVVTINVILIYACLAELIMFTKTKRRMFWASSIIGAIFIPMAVLGALSMSASQYPFLWLFTAFPVIALPNAELATVFMAILAQWSILALLNLQLTQQLRIAGESASKALFDSKQSLPAKG